MRTPWPLAVLIAIAIAAAPVQPSVAATPRVVSLNLCTDQLLLALAPKEQIVALSFLADDADVSAIAAAAAAFRTIRGEAEEVLALDPDLVLAGEWTTQATVALLRRLGRRVEVVPMSASLAAIRDNVRLVARHLGRHAEGERQIADLDRRLAAIAPAPGADWPTALVYYTDSITAGAQTLADVALAAAGFRNLAAERGIIGLGTVPLEVLIADPPDLIVLGDAAEAYRTVAADNLRHPALARLLTRVDHVVVPQPLLICDTPGVIAAIELLAVARERLRRHESSP